VTAGSAGAIHARTQIDSAITWWRQTLGEGCRVSVRWDRTGAQTFPLLARGDWSVFITRPLSAALLALAVALLLLVLLPAIKSKRKEAFVED
jgi:hypothetical protein